MYAIGFGFHAVGSGESLKYTEKENNIVSLVVLDIDTEYSGIHKEDWLKTQI